jgi:antitoxin component YwqK of YwqJK toxin-antitoxin module
MTRAISFYGYRLCRIIAPVMRFLLLILIGISACSKGNQVTEKDPDLGMVTTYTVDQKTGKYHGPYTKTDSLGVLMEKGSFNQGEQQGIRELYYKDGKVKVRERYKAGELDDLYEYFFPDGTLELRGYYVDGAMYGRWIKNTPEGTLFEEVTMIDNEEMGPFREYHPNGKIQAEGTYLHGPNEDGGLKLYDETGQLHKEMLCYNGRCYTLWQKE